MSAPRKSVKDLRESGSRHYPKAELKERESREVHALPTDTLAPPVYLPGSLVGQFHALAAKLRRMGALTELDADALARYLVAESNYIKATNKLTAALNAGNARDADRWSAIQDRFFRQCRAVGADLGLTAPGRSRMTLPPAPPEDEGSDLFGDG